MKLCGNYSCFALCHSRTQYFTVEGLTGVHPGILQKAAEPSGLVGVESRGKAPVGDLGTNSLRI